MMEISMRMFVNLLLGDEVDALVDLAEATSADLSRHFPSLLDNDTMKMISLTKMTALKIEFMHVNQLAFNFCFLLYFDLSTLV